MGIRRAAVAGSWYPAEPSRLAAEVSRYVGAVRGGTDMPPHADVVALVAPHAGLMYSGPVAAYAYALLEPRRYDAIVLVGPSHYVGFEGASIWPRGAFDTPLGPLAIDEPLAARLLDNCDVLADVPEAHQREHSLEMQLPFLASFAPQTPIVPIVMGFQTRETAFALGDAIGSAISGRHLLLIASSDLSHFYDATTAAMLDHDVITRVEQADEEGLMTLLERRPDHACGGGPIVSVMHAARAEGAAHARVLRYADSGDVSGDKSSVVGYMAAALWR